VGTQTRLHWLWRKPPDPNWPNGARLAVNFVMNYEEGSEPSVQDGEGFTELGLTEAHGLIQGVKGRDLAGESMFEYGSRVGFWRLLRLFHEREMPIDRVRLRPRAGAQSRGRRRNPAAGYDVCCTGGLDQSFRPHPNEEQEHIRKAIASCRRPWRTALRLVLRYGPR